VGPQAWLCAVRDLSDYSGDCGAGVSGAGHVENFFAKDLRGWVRKKSRKRIYPRESVLISGKEVSQLAMWNNGAADVGSPYIIEE
jgi:hypothetical protein